jgi:hypothetical protein
VHPKTSGNRNNAEDGSFALRILDGQDVPGSHSCQIVDRAEIIFPQPIRHFWILRFGAG